jgi:hypothetical protein
VKANIRLEHELLAVEAEHEVNAMLELVAPPRDVEAPRLPLNLALVIDRSGSMAGEKLETTKRCARFLVERLAPTDRLAIVTYDDEVELRAPLAAVDNSALSDVIDGIHAGGSTNLSGGWLKGTEVLRGANCDRPRKVILLSDGLANVGVVEPDRLASMARAAGEQNVGTSTIGFGDGFDEDLMKAMADAGRGSRHGEGRAHPGLVVPDVADQHVPPGLEGHGQRLVVAGVEHGLEAGDLHPRSGDVHQLLAVDRELVHRQVGPKHRERVADLPDVSELERDLARRDLDPVQRDRVLLELGDDLGLRPALRLRLRRGPGRLVRRPSTGGRSQHQHSCE